MADNMQPGPGHACLPPASPAEFVQELVLMPKW